MVHFIGISCFCEKEMLLSIQIVRAKNLVLIIVLIASSQNLTGKILSRVGLIDANILFIASSNDRQEKNVK